MVLASIKNKLGVASVFLLSVYFLNPYEINFYLNYVIPLLVVSTPHLTKHNFDSNAFILLLFSITYSLFFALDPTTGQQYIIIYALVPTTFYLLGKNSATKLEYDHKLIFYLLLCLGFLHSFSALLSVSDALISEGFISVDRNLPNFWTGNVVLATIMGSYFTFNMCIPGIIIVGNLGRFYALFFFGLLIYIVSVLCILKIGSRTQLGISFLTTIVSFIYIIPRQSLKRNLITFLIIGLAGFFLVTKLNFDFEEGWLSAYAGRMEEGGADDIASGGGRMERWEKSIEYLFKKPLGWEIEQFGHAHNLWLDVLRVSGFIPFFILLVFSIKNFKNIWRAIKKNTSALSFNNQTIIYSLAILSVFMLEPILEGMIPLFAFFCFYVGCLNAYTTS